MPLHGSIGRDASPLEEIAGDGEELTWTSALGMQDMHARLYGDDGGITRI